MKIMMNETNVEMIFARRKCSHRYLDMTTETFLSFSQDSSFYYQLRRVYMLLT